MRRLARLSAAHAHNLILAVFALLALVYCISTPIFEKPDEDTHFAYARHLALGGGLPVQQPGVMTPWAQEGSQPPLYYALASLVIRGFDTHNFPGEQRPNAAPLYDPYAPGNKNKLLITPEKRALAYRDTTAAAALLRLLGIVPGLLAAWATYRVALRLGAARQTALLALGLTAFNPMLIYISTSVSNDGLVIALSSCALLALVLLLLDESPSRGSALWRAALLGSLIALASLTKLSGAVLLPIAFTAIAARALIQARAQPGSARAPFVTAALQAGVVLALWLLIAGWWYARNYALYGDVTGTAVMAQIAGARHLFLAQAWREFDGFRMSYSAMFGQFNIPADRFVYSLFDLLLVVSTLGLTIAASRTLRRLGHPGWSSPDSRRAVAALLLAAHVILTLAGILRWTMITQASQGRLLFPAVAAFSTLLAIGLRQFDRPIRPSWIRLPGLVAPAVVGLMGALAVFAPLRYIMPAYAPPLLDHVPEGLRLTRQQFPPWAELVAYRMTPALALPGQKVHIVVVLRALQTPRDDYSLVTKLYGRDNAELARFDTFTGGGLLPSSQWRPGDLWRDEALFTVPLTAAAPAILRAQFELYNHGSGDIMVSRDEHGRKGAPLFDGATLLPPGAVGGPPNSFLATFGAAGKLSAFNVTDLRPGQPLTVTLVWLALAPTLRDHSVFVHLTDAAGKQWAQHDGPPDGGNFPTSRWSDGVSFADAHMLNVPADLPRGTYALVVGLYDPTTGERLAVHNGRGEEQPDRAFVLQQFTTR